MVIWNLITKYGTAIQLVAAILGIIWFVFWVRSCFPSADIAFTISAGEFRSPYLLVEDLFLENQGRSPEDIANELQIKEALQQENIDREAIGQKIGDHLKKLFRSREDLRRKIGGYVKVDVKNLTAHDIDDCYLIPVNTLAFRALIGGVTTMHKEELSGAPIKKIPLGRLEANQTITFWLWTSSPQAISQIKDFQFIVPNGINKEITYGPII